MTPMPTPTTQAGWKLTLSLPIASGVLLLASFWLPILVWIALVPLGLLARLSADRRLLYLGAWLGGLTFFVPGVQWIRYCDPSAWLGWLLLALYLSLYFPAFVLMSRVLNRRWSVPMILVTPVCWVALEYVRMHFLSGFGWLLLAHSIYRWTWTIQIADFAGVYGVSFLIAMVNGFLIDLMTTPLVTLRKGRLRPSPLIAWGGGLTVAAIVATIGYGIYRTRQADFYPGPQLLLIQTSLPQSLKDNDAEATFEHAIRLTAGAMKQVRAKKLPVDLVIWPETSYPFVYGDIAPGLSDVDIDRLKLERRARSGKPVGEPSAEEGKAMREGMVAGAEHLTKITDELELPLLIGAIRNDFQPDRFAQYNSSVLFVPGKGATTWYDKIHLVPFGEYLPLENLFPFLKRLMPYDPTVDFGLDASTQFKTIEHDKLHFASLICFEDTLPHLAREFLVRESPGEPIDFFVNQSNDGWFQGSIEADYHLAASVFRSVEGRIPLVRASNTGITALVDGNGALDLVFTEKQSGKTKLVAGAMNAIIPLDDRRAPYITLGDWLPQGCLALVLLGLALSIGRHVRKIVARKQ